MTCRFVGCEKLVAAPGMSRCHEHRLRWLPSQSVEQPARGPQARIPEWRRRSLAKVMGGWNPAA